MKRRMSLPSFDDQGLEIEFQRPKERTKTWLIMLLKWRMSWKKKKYLLLSLESASVLKKKSEGL